MAAKRKTSRVFVLGAGVSASCGIPVAQNLLQKAMDRLVNDNRASWDRIHKLLDYLYPNFSVALRNYPNIEDFMNLIEMAQEFNSEEYIQSRLWPDNELKRVQRTVLQAVTDYLWAQMKDCNLDPLMKFVAHCLHNGDTIITFNWDVTIEKALEADARYDFWYKPTTDILLLKPHGSIDWFRHDKLPKDLGTKAVRKVDDTISVYPEFTLAKHQKLKTQPPVIVPPVFQKDFTLPFFKETWRRIYFAVSRATRLHFIGYSLPNEDQFARLVLSRAIRNNKLNVDKGKKQDLTIRVVNPDETAQQTFIRRAGRGINTRFEFFHTTFDRFVHSVEEGLITL